MPMNAPWGQATWGHGYWQQDMNQECYTGAHLTAVYWIGVPGILIGCIGIPLASFLITYKHRRRLKEDDVATIYGFIYHQYRCVLLRVACQIIQQHPVNHSQCCASHAAHVCTQQRAEQAVTPLLLPSLSPRKRYFYWNTVEQLRLLLLVAIAVFGRLWTAFIQLHTFIFVLLVSVVVNELLRPAQYASKLETISLAAMGFIMFLSLYFVDQDFSEDPPPHGGLPHSLCSILCSPQCQGFSNFIQLGTIDQPDYTLRTSLDEPQSLGHCRSKTIHKAVLVPCWQALWTRWPSSSSCSTSWSSSTWRVSSSTRAAPSSPSEACQRCSCWRHMCAQRSPAIEAALVQSILLMLRPRPGGRGWRRPGQGLAACCARTDHA